jgi:hypothetical protein
VQLVVVDGAEPTVQLELYYGSDCIDFEELAFFPEEGYASFTSYEEACAAATAHLAPLGTSVFLCCFEDKGELAMEVYYDLAAYAYLPRTEGVAAILAATAGLSRESLPASETPPDAASTKPCTAGQALTDMGWSPPCWVYRCAAYVAAWVVLFVLGLFRVCGSVLVTFVCPLDALLLLSLPRLAAAWQRLEVWVESCTDDPEAKPPKLPYFAPGRRSRKRGRDPWHRLANWRMNRRKHLTGSILRNAKRYLAAKQHYETCMRTVSYARAAVSLSTNLTFRGVLPLLLVTCTCFVASAVAIPDLLDATRVLTTSLAAHEIQGLGGYRFRSGLMV